MVLSVDVLGGDNAPDSVIQGCALVSADAGGEGVFFRLHGPEDGVKALCQQYGMPSDRYEIIHAPDVITNHDAPATAIRQKTQSSLVSALTDLKQKRAEAFLSAGSTGAVLAGGIFKVGRLPGVARPALAPLMPTRAGNPTLLLDIGANVDSKPAYLQQFGVMGSVFMKHVMHVPEPRVGLLNIGAEAEKGNELTAAAYPLLQEAAIRFMGNVEARDALGGDYDVVVTDGFAGNILLKGTEGAAEMIFGMLKEELMASPTSKLGALIMKKAFRRLKKKLDYTEYGGALLLGIDGVIVKAHGSSNAKAIASAVRQAANAVSSGVIERLTEAFSGMTVS